jgi:hypothetical protein
MPTKTVWVIAADASRARVLQVASRQKLAEVASLRREYGKEVGKLVKDEVPKDLSWLSKQELEGYFSREGRSL